MLYEQLFCTLEELIVTRQIEDLFKLLSEEEYNIRAIEPNHPLLSRFIYRVSQAHVFGYTHSDLLTALLSKVPLSKRSDRPDLFLYIGRGVKAISRHHPSFALRYFGRVLGFPKTKEMTIFVKQCMGNIWRRQANYTVAFKLHDDAYSLASRHPILPAIRADVGVDLAWDYFQLNRVAAARILYNDCLLCLSAAKDHRRCADIHAALGRVNQRLGNLAAAENCTKESLLLYARPALRLDGTCHDNEHRAQINLAKITWLIARQIGAQIKQLDLHIDRTGLLNDEPVFTIGMLEQLMSKTGRQCLTPNDLQRAIDRMRRNYFRCDSHRAGLLTQQRRLLDDSISRLTNLELTLSAQRRPPHYRTLGRLHIIWAHVEDEKNNFEIARKRAAMAHHLGITHNDPLLISRAQIMTAMLRMRAVMEDSMPADEQRREANEALLEAHDALRLSTSLQNNRLAVKIYTWTGFANFFLGNCDDACHALINAKQRLSDDLPDDYVARDVYQLSHYCHKATVQRVLALVNHPGSLADISKEFRDLVICSDLSVGRPVGDIIRQRGIGKKAVQKAKQHLNT